MEYAYTEGSRTPASYCSYLLHADNNKEKLFHSITPAYTHSIPLNTQQHYVHKHICTIHITRRHPFLIKHTFTTHIRAPHKRTTRARAFARASQQSMLNTQNELAARGWPCPFAAMCGPARNAFATHNPHTRAPTLSHSHKPITHIPRQRDGHGHVCRRLRRSMCLR